jgi:hypothetical protein
VTYAIAFTATSFTFYFFLIQDGVTAELKKLNWASVVFGFAALGIELGSCSPIVQVGIWQSPACWSVWSLRCSSSLWPYLYSGTNFSLVNVLAIFCCFVGLLMLNWKR